MARSTLPLMAAFVAGAAAFAAPSTHAVRSPRTQPARPLMMASWKDEAIFDKKVEDPVFQADSGYKGRVPYGFSNAAEKFNGRAAMMGFSVAYVQEWVVGKGVLEQYGLPYDEGAILIKSEGFSLPSVVGLVLALVVVFGLSYGGEFLNNKVLNPDYKGSSMPFSPFANKDE